MHLHTKFIVTNWVILHLVKLCRQKLSFKQNKRSWCMYGLTWSVEALQPNQAPETLYHFYLWINWTQSKIFANSMICPFLGNILRKTITFIISCEPGSRRPIQKKKISRTRMMKREKSGRYPCLVFPLSMPAQQGNGKNGLQAPQSRKEAAQDPGHSIHKLKMRASHAYKSATKVKCWFLLLNKFLIFSRSEHHQRGVNPEYLFVCLLPQSKEILTSIEKRPFQKAWWIEVNFGISCHFQGMTAHSCGLPLPISAHNLWLWSSCPSCPEHYKKYFSTPVKSTVFTLRIGILNYFFSTFDRNSVLFWPANFLDERQQNNKKSSKRTRILLK